MQQTTSEATPANVEHADCVVVGGGPAGTVLSLLLARSGVEATLLETQFPKPATREELSGFTAPALILAAEHDLFSPPEKVIPNLRAAEVLEGCGHLPAANCARLICEKVGSFLAEGR